MRAGWHEGTIGIPKDGNNRVAHYWVKNYKNRNKNAIDGGKISKLLIKIGNETVADYDNGWICKPDEDDYMVMVAYSILLKEYN